MANDAAAAAGEHDAASLGVDSPSSAGTIRILGPARDLCRGFLAVPLVLVGLAVATDRIDAWMPSEPANVEAADAR